MARLLLEELGPVLPELRDALLPGRGELERLWKENRPDYLALALELPDDLPHLRDRLQFPERGRPGRRTPGDRRGSPPGSPRGTDQYSAKASTQRATWTSLTAHTVAAASSRTSAAASTRCRLGQVVMARIVTALPPPPAFQSRLLRDRATGPGSRAPSSRGEPVGRVDWACEPVVPWRGRLGRSALVQLLDELGRRRGEP